MKIRERYNFRGQVQGVGFRYTAYHAAVAYGLTGFVMNEYDGSVTMEVQGDEPAIEEMVQRLGDGRWIQIEDVSSEELPIIVDESIFEIK